MLYYTYKMHNCTWERPYFNYLCSCYVWYTPYFACVHKNLLDNIYCKQMRGMETQCTCNCTVYLLSIGVCRRLRVKNTWTYKQSAVHSKYLVYWRLISHFLGLWRRPRLLLHFSREIKSRFRNPKFPLDLLVAALRCHTSHYISLHFTTFHRTTLFELGCSLFPAWAGASWPGDGFAEGNEGQRSFTD